MRFSTEWSSDALNAAPEEHATVADLQVWIGDQNVAMHLIDDENENHLTLPMYSLVEGLIHDWWILFGGRDREVSLIKYRMGYAVPDVRFKFDGAAFEVTAHQYAYRNPNVRFWAGPSEVLSRSNAERVLDKLIEDVLQRLNDSKVLDTSAALRWARVRESRANSEEVEFCEAAGALGVDPYQIDDAQATVISAASDFFNGEALTEFLAGARRNPIAPLLDWVRKVEHLPRYTSRIAELTDIATAAAAKSPSKEGERSWELGYRRARALRSTLGLKAADRLRSYRALAEKLGAGKQFKLGPRVDGIRALRSDRDDGVHIFLRNHGNSPDAKTGETFTFSRAVGDVVCFPAPSRAPVNELHDAFRQAAGRAFAAEFLAPVEEILSMRRDGRDIQSIADEFSVATAVIERQLENVDRIEKACA